MKTWLSLAGAGDISHKGFVGWRSALWCPALKPACSPAIIFSACGFNLFSMIFSMTVLGWLMRLSGTAAGCLSWQVWWLRTGSTGLAILQSARSYCRLSWERWLHPLHLLGPVLLGCCRLQYNHWINHQLWTVSYQLNTPLPLCSSHRNSCFRFCSFTTGLLQFPPFWMPAVPSKHTLKG